ncbi:MAG: hypothetical protein ABL903_08665 [Methylococcales bacterium]
MDIEKNVEAIEADAGMPLPELRQSLAGVQKLAGRIHTPEQIQERTAKTKARTSKS